MGNDPPQIVLRDATLGYPGRTVLRDVGLRIDKGDFLAIVGPNGSGKTTLLRTVLGILRPLSGTCLCTARLGYAPQRSQLDPVFPLSALEVVSMGLLGTRPEPSKEEVRQRAEKALEACGMLAMKDHLLREMSGGQKQRVLVARALVSDPEVLILDEPTNDLDLQGEHEVMEVLLRLHDEAGKTIVMVSHILQVVARYAERLAVIFQGTLKSGTLRAMLTREQMLELYGIPVEVGAFGGHLTVVPAIGGRHGLEEGDDG